jgi:hypothetical protein
LRFGPESRHRGVFKVMKYQGRAPRESGNPRSDWVRRSIIDLKPDLMGQVVCESEATGGDDNPPGGDLVEALDDPAA